MDLKKERKRQNERESSRAGLQTQGHKRLLLSVDFENKRQTIRASSCNWRVRNSITTEREREAPVGYPVLKKGKAEQSFSKPGISNTCLKLSTTDFSASDSEGSCCVILKNNIGSRERLSF